MFFKRSNDLLQKAIIDDEGLQHVKERHIELYDLVRNRFKNDFVEDQVYALIEEQLQEVKRIGYNDELMILRNDGYEMVITKDTGRVIGTRGETHITLVLRDNGDHWRLVTAYPKVIIIPEIKEEEEDEAEEKIFYTGFEDEEEEEEDEADWFNTGPVTYELYNPEDDENWDDE